ncbi:CDP-alcohol phosphatidyltransferase family protein [Paracrocinitomix mangrovi]|uniref:CDP-alcohol phosphatidyltransferase family protein n=1 Tax=Paracrocinitomix mangrovi TaxID=2862509 RepID=UPI001C8E97EE|nr:CDP-alcohol phosphatidyltransferase family protein [Paracrocinitomix mangrovi]UKN00251.1 CDP-alcohol phosphatidyltransferase family protein [Paracrocinitomix mangrovi]
MKHVPFLLIYSRIIMGVLIGVLAYFQLNNYPFWIVTLMSLGLITDLFDGIIARKLGVSSDKLRIWDSNVDVFFWLIVIASVFYLNVDFVKDNIIWISLVIVLEIIAYMISFLKFKKTIATHSILAKIWSLSLLIFLIDLTLNENSNLAFIICIVLGLISRIEINLIIIRLNEWATDIPSIFSVPKINKGIAIKKSRFLNS